MGESSLESQIWDLFLYIARRISMAGSQLTLPFTTGTPFLSLALLKISAPWQTDETILPAKISHMTWIYFLILVGHELTAYTYIKDQQIQDLNLLLYFCSDLHRLSTGAQKYLQYKLQKNKFASLPQWIWLDLFTSSLKEQAKWRRSRLHYYCKRIKLCLYISLLDHSYLVSSLN